MTARQAASRRTGHTLRARRHYERQQEAMVVARRFRERGLPALADVQVRLARGWGRAARQALRIAAMYEAR